MSTEIYYFSGTGNSLHVAKELQQRLPAAALTPIVRLLPQDSIRASADTVGFVFPNFCLTMPIPLYKFLQKMDLSSASYIFAICTRGGSPSQAFDYINATLKRQGKKLHAQLNVTMPWNHPTGKENLAGTSTAERIGRLEALMHGKLDGFAKLVAARQEYLPADTDADYGLSSGIKVFDRLVSKSLNYKFHQYMYQKLVRFYSDERCRGCGTCEKVCVSGKIEMVDGHPSWKPQVDCYACFACINFCPQQAIQVQSRFPISSYTRINGRYHHPSVSYKDIAEQR